METAVKQQFLLGLAERFGPPRRLAGSHSLYSLSGDRARVYVRYSKVHSRGRTFYGLRKQDLAALEGHVSAIAFLWDGQSEPLTVPFRDYEEVFRAVTPASDGQYKVQVLLEGPEKELYIAQAGRFNVEGNLGWHAVETLVGADRSLATPDLSHWQVQTILGAIGSAKGYEVWVPTSDRGKLDWDIAVAYGCCNQLPPGFAAIEHILQEIDVVWLESGAPDPVALFEVEHSTPIYSGLLRFNDVHLVAPNMRPRFSIVANDVRRDAFVRQLARPTFRASGLNDLCTFLDYDDVYSWFGRLRQPMAR